MGLGRKDKGGNALLLISVDTPVSLDLIKEMNQVKDFKEVRTIKLSGLDSREYLQF